MIEHLYFSTPHYDWKTTDLKCLTQRNIDKSIASTQSSDYWTTLDDLSAPCISTACQSAEKITLVDIEINNSFSYAHGRLFYELNKVKHKVTNFDNIIFAPELLRNRSEDCDKILWTAGCSLTTGVGVSTDQRWGSLLSKKLNTPERTLAKGGSSIFYSADQILRSDIRAGDIVVWGLTNLPRVEISKLWQFKPITIKMYNTLPIEDQYWTLDYFDSETIYLKAIHYVYQVINFCKKIGAQLYIANLSDISWLAFALRNLENYIDLTTELSNNNHRLEFIDIGTDGLHPGLLQHQQYAEAIFNLIKENNHGKTI
jgi:lysophospholipase L1-like esterase